MNKRIIMIWLAILAPILLFVYIFAMKLITNAIIRYILSCIMFAIVIIIFFAFAIFLNIIGTPKNQIPNNVNMSYYLNDIECTQIKGGVYRVNICNKKLILDMSGWIFKRQYIRDIVLMYLHLNYYNFHKFSLKKIRSKKYFPGKTLSINFKLLNGTTKKLFLIKNGVEQRSSVCSMKLLFISRQSIIRLKLTNIDNREYLKCDINFMYI